MKKTTLKNINNWISEGFEKRNSESSKECCDFFLKAWEMLHEEAPKKYTDFSELVEKYNQGADDYDWGAWIWEVGEELGVAGKQAPECLTHRIEFIEAFKNRFPDTSDEELMEYLQRILIKTNFLLGNDEAGEQAVKAFYEKMDYSVWGYIEWADALVAREAIPTKKLQDKALAIYEKGLSLKDDEEFMDILKERIQLIKGEI